MSLRDEILKTNDLAEEKVTIEEWNNVEILVKMLTAKQRADLIRKCINLKTNEVDSGKMYIYTVIYCAYDPETNEQIFSESDYDALASKSANAIDKIVEVANRINGLGEGEITQLEKN